jgi:hypothetical protein
MSRALAARRVSRSEGVFPPGMARDVIFSSEASEFPPGESGYPRFTVFLKRGLLIFPCNIQAEPAPFSLRSRVLAFRYRIDSQTKFLSIGRIPVPRPCFEGALPFRDQQVYNADSSQAKTAYLQKRSEVPR